MAISTYTLSPSELSDHFTTNVRIGTAVLGESGSAFVFFSSALPAPPIFITATPIAVNANIEIADVTETSFRCHTNTGGGMAGVIIHYHAWI